jgi:hypothetical protein
MQPAKDARHQQLEAPGYERLLEEPLRLSVVGGRVAGLYPVERGDEGSGVQILTEDVPVWLCILLLSRESPFLVRRNTS